MEGIVVEEFTRQHDYLHHGSGQRGLDAGCRLVEFRLAQPRHPHRPGDAGEGGPTSRHEAEGVYRALGGGQLPTTPVLRTHFLDHQPIANAAPLRLGPAQPPAGFHERRLYRVLFAKDLRADQVASLRAAWRTPVDGTNASAASGHLDKDGDQLTWELRRVGHTLAWCLDVTVLLSTAAADAVGSTLSDLTDRPARARSDTRDD